MLALLFMAGIMLFGGLSPRPIGAAFRFPLVNARASPLTRVPHATIRKYPQCSS